MEPECVLVCIVLIIEISVPEKSILNLYSGFLLNISKAGKKKKSKSKKKKKYPKKQKTNTQKTDE